MPLYGHEGVWVAGNPDEVVNALVVEDDVLDADVLWVSAMDEAAIGAAA